jgi:predicted MPP superfamily phosphohydrolase
MLHDFTIIVKKFPENKDITIVPVGDIHLGAAEHMEAAWREFRTKILENPNAYILLLGDLLNNAIKSSVSNIYDEIIRPREAKKMMVEMLKPLKDRILCAVTGNHERRSSREVDDDAVYDIMCKLDLEDLYRENIAFLKIQMGDQNGNGQYNPTYVLVVTHGAGGGVLTGGVINRAERFAYAIDGADALVVGHSHKPFVSQPGKLKIDPYNNIVSVKPFKVISASSWLDYGGYAAQKNLLPTTHAAQKLILCGNKKDLRVEM